MFLIPGNPGVNLVISEHVQTVIGAEVDISVSCRCILFENQRPTPKFSVPDALRHNRKSYVGLRVGGKDFENACLAPSQLRNQPPTAGGGPGHQLSLQTTEDVRFVFMDYASKTRAQCNCSKVCAGEGESFNLLCFLILG